MSNYKRNGAALNTILESGTTGYTNTYPGLTTRVTSFSNSLPAVTGYRINGQDIANTTTAKHTIYSDVGTNTINKPTGSTKLRYMLIGGAGGGGGGCGGGYNNDPGTDEDHALLGFDGKNGFQGQVQQGTITLNSTVNTISLTIGAGGTGGAGGNAVVIEGTAALNSGTSGNSGNQSQLIYDTTTITCPGGAGGTGGTANVPGGARTIENDRGHGSSWLGWENSNAAFKGSGGSGLSVYGLCDRDTNGNIDYTPNTPTHTLTYITGWEDSLTLISSNDRKVGIGGIGGWGHGLTPKGATGGRPGTDGDNGRAALIWLYE